MIGSYHVTLLHISTNKLASNIAATTNSARQQPQA
jgi:hypothetical protein